MQDESMTITADLRFWCDGFSLKAIAACFPGRVDYLYDIGEPTLLPSGEASTRMAERHYLALKGFETHDVTSVPALIERCLDELWRDGYVNAHVKNTPIETVLWVSAFGTEKIGFDELCIDPEPFGRKIGLVVENYMSLTEEGHPERWLIEASTSNTQPGG